MGHLAHVAWYCRCMTGVMLALNRLIELKWPDLGVRLYGGNRTWFWLLPIFLYGLLTSIAIDLPSVYNSYYTVYIFQIDLREGAESITKWLWFGNSVWVCTALVTIYTMILLEIRRRGPDAPTICTEETVTTRQATGIAFLVCLPVFLWAFAYALCIPVQLPLPLTELAKMALWLCFGRK